jgi:hypothetical protein
MTTPAPKPARLRPRDRDAIISSLRSGVVPRAGFQHIQVGRAAEVSAMSQEITRIADGGSAVRFVIGEYGAGKTFFLNLVRSIAAERKLVTTSADLSPDRRLHASGGQARSLYAELMRNIATRSTPGRQRAAQHRRAVRDLGDPGSQQRRDVAGRGYRRSARTAVGKCRRL